MAIIPCVCQGKAVERLKEESTRREGVLQVRPLYFLGIWSHIRCKLIFQDKIAELEGELNILKRTKVLSEMPLGNSCRIGTVRHPGTYFFFDF